METYKTPDTFTQVEVATKSNLYFDGKVISRTINFADGTRKTLGILFAGTYSFDTAVAERMEITTGTCKVRLAGVSDWTEYSTDSWFDIPAESSFEISVSENIAEYICSYG